MLSTAHPMPTCPQLDAANTSLLEGRLDEALRAFFRHLAANSERADTVSFNISLARRRYRLRRDVNALATAVIACSAGTFARATARAQATGAVLVALGPEAEGGSEPTITATGGGDLPARALDFVLENPMDLVRLSAPCAAAALVGLLYHLVWGAQVVYDLSGEIGDSADQRLLGPLASDWRALRAAEADFVHLFPVATVDTEALQIRFGGTLPGAAADGAPTLPPMALPALGSLLDTPLREAFESVGGVAALTGRAKAAVPYLTSEPTQERPYLVDVVVAIYNALEDVKACIESLKRAQTTCRLRVILVNDGSEKDTTDWLREVVAQPCPEHVALELIEHPENLGYTRTVNTGLRHSIAPYVVTLNSDTIVTDGWIEGLIRCINSSPEIGICGPMSNAASWQNVPDLYGPDTAFAINALPEGMTPDDMVAVVSRASARTYPRTTFVNGFCFMVRRAVIDAVGYMDEEAFPVGYGEENDFCIRAQDAGFALAYADDTYVFHAKSKSFGSERRVELSKAGSDAIKRKHTAEKFAALVDRVKDTAPMDLVRARIQKVLAGGIDTRGPAVWDCLMSLRILFVLPVKGGSGGAHSVVQEAVAMRRMGVDARVGVNCRNLASFHQQYEDVPEAEAVFLGFEPPTLLTVAADFDVVVATIFNSVELVKRVVDAFPWIVPAYYIQDYEPLFFTRNDPNWAVAHASYTAVPGMVNFAKTHWIRREVARFHGVRVAKVRPSIDHDVYTPRPCRSHSDGRIHISAMIRPGTPRRGAHRTMALLARLSHKHGDAIAISIFGCEADDPKLVALERDFPHDCLGILTRPKVAALLQCSDLFIDLSDYQAFGRTALEAMACGSLALVPERGGADEYAVHGKNAIVVNTLDPEACFRAVDAVISDRMHFAVMRVAALETANGYSPRRAAVSILDVLGRAVATKRRGNPVPERTRVVLLPGVGIAGKTSRVGQTRLVAPFTQDALLKHISVRTLMGAQLPDAKLVDVAVVQGGTSIKCHDMLLGWLDAVKSNGGRVVFDLDDQTFAADPSLSQTLVRGLLARADLVTVADQRQATALGVDGPTVMVFPDRLDTQTWSRAIGALGRPRDAAACDDVVKIGYFGSQSNYDDAALVAPAVQCIAKEYGGRVVFEAIGAFQDRPPLFGTRIGLPRRRDYQHFADWLPQAAKWDILLLPLRDNHTVGSRLHFLEASVLGGAIICSANEALVECAYDGETCLVVPNTDDAWVAAIRRLIEDRALRHALACAASAQKPPAHGIGRANDLARKVLARIKKRV